MKNRVCIVLCLCSALLACNRENTETTIWRDSRLVEARLSGAKWHPYERPAGLQTSCDDPVDSRDAALSLLVVAGGECLEKALRAVERHSREDLAAAHLIRFERNGDAVELLRALENANGFNRALALERLQLTKEAIQEWNGVVQEHSEWSNEARRHLEQLQQLSDPVREWNLARIGDALQHRNTVTLTRIAREFPIDTARYFEKSDLRDRERARLLANALTAAGEHYPQAVVDAMKRPRDRAALEQGLAAFRDKNYRRAATLLERAGNPLHLAARYYVSSSEFLLPELDATLAYLKPEYRELSSRIQMFRANLLEFDDRFLEAHTDYKKALAFAKEEPTVTAATLARRSVNFTFIGDAENAFRDAHRAVTLLSHVADTDTRNQAYGSAAIAARQLGVPNVALLYQNAAVEDTRRAVVDASESARAGAKHELAVALRARAEIHVQLKQDADAEEDLQQAVELTEAANLPNMERVRNILQMHNLDVRGQTRLKNRPAEAAALFSEAIELAKAEDSTYRAILHLERGEALRNAGDPRSDDESAAAMKILRDEVQRSLIADPQRASEPLWSPYFVRFRKEQDELIESRILAGDVEGAFVHAELARAFEPMQILLQSRPVPSGFRPIESPADLQQARNHLPDDTVILQSLALPQRTYTWVVTRERISVVRQSVTKAKIERWVEDAQAAAAEGQEYPFTRVTRAAYAELFREPLKLAGASKTRIVIVPDDSMQGFPFNALNAAEEGYLIERASIAVEGSTTLYLYALARDRQLAANRNPKVLLIGDPAFASYPRLPYARREVEELSRDYDHGAEVLTDAAATVEKFLLGAKNATVIHFAGHALASRQMPWQSRLLFASQERESGELSAQRLMRELPRLERARLVVLGACSTAGGGSVGPQGLAPLVRPLIAADVPGVVGTLWDVKDASAKELLVSLHCHYRHGDDVAVSLRNAQLEMLRNKDKDSARKWAAFQVVGYAASPYARSVALEDPSIEHLCTQNSLHRPDGLRSQ